MADAGKKAAPSPDDDDILDLTEVVAESEAEPETLIELPSELQDLDSLDFKALLGEESEAAAPEPESESPVEEAASPEIMPAVSESEPTAVDEEATADLEESLLPVVESHTVEQIVERVMANFDEPRLRQIIEPLLVEIAERLCRELFPAIAETAIAREIEEIKKSLQEDG